MRRVGLAVVALATMVWGSYAPAASVSMSALTTFGSSGWLAPNGTNGSTYAYLESVNSLDRGLAFGNGHVYLVSRVNVGGNAINIRMLDANTGADLGGLNNTGITGGTFVVNAAGVDGNGAIYVANLTTQSTTSPFKVYRWATESSAPTVAYSGDSGLPGSRVGDDLAVTSGAGVRIVAGYNNSPSVTGDNGYAIIDPTVASSTAVGFTGTPPNAGDFRLGLTFLDSSHVIGTAGSSLYRYSSFSGATGTLIASPAIPDAAGATSDRLMAYAVVDGLPILAIQSIGDSHVSLYDMTDPTHPAYLTAADNVVGTPATNGNGTGQMAWNVPSPTSTTATLYAMSTNQGIQAFTITVPEPASVAMLAIAGLLGVRRRM